MAKEEQEVKEHMTAHFNAIQNIQRDIIHGNLDNAKVYAEALAAHKPHPDLAEEAEVETVRALAVEIAKTTSLAEAAPLTAKLAGECGACHERMKAKPSFDSVEEPTNPDKVKARMQRHQWAMDALWKGIVAPSDAAWTEAAEILVSVPLLAEDIAPDAKKKQVSGLSGKLQALGVRASDAADKEARIALYGELLTLCSQCHAEAREDSAD